MGRVGEKVFCRIKDLGLIGYQEAYDLQKKTVKDVIAGQADALIICEHPPVFTLGRLATEANFFLPPEKVKAKGIDVTRIDRGGEVTLHAPGQLVVYPIFNLDHFTRDLRIFLEKLEEVAIDLLKYFGIVAHSIEGQRGVWVNQNKIASIGIGVRKWVTFHGMAININTDLKYFDMIRPCGLNVKMTSVKELKGHPINLNEAKSELLKSFSKKFNLEIQE